MGHAISRTKPSIMAFDLFAREPSIDVFCGGWSAAVIDATPQPANKQKRKIRFIRPPFHPFELFHGSKGFRHIVQPVMTISSFSSMNVDKLCFRISV